MTVLENVAPNLIQVTEDGHAPVLYGLDFKTSKLVPAGTDPEGYDPRWLRDNLAVRTSRPTSWGNPLTVYITYGGSFHVVWSQVWDDMSHTFISTEGAYEPCD